MVIIPDLATIVASFLMLYSGVRCAPQASHESRLEKRTVSQLASLIKRCTGRCALDYNGYGCYCGLGGSGTPVDAVDVCCKNHDNCYSGTSCRKIWPPHVVSYSYSCAGGCNCMCLDKVGTCDYQACQCDIQLATCLAAAPYIRAHKGFCPNSTTTSTTTTTTASSTTPEESTTATTTDYSTGTTTPGDLSTQTTTPSDSTTPGDVSTFTTTPEDVTTQSTTPGEVSTLTTTPSDFTTPGDVSTFITTPRDVVTFISSPADDRTPSTTPGDVSTFITTPEDVSTFITTPGGVSTFITTPGGVSTPSPTPLDLSSTTFVDFSGTTSWFEDDFNVFDVPEDVCTSD